MEVQVFSLTVSLDSGNIDKYLLNDGSEYQLQKTNCPEVRMDLERPITVNEKATAVSCSGIVF